MELKALVSIAPVAVETPLNFVLDPDEFTLRMVVLPMDTVPLEVLNFSAVEEKDSPDNLLLFYVG